MPQTRRHVRVQYGGQAVLQRRPNEMFHLKTCEDVHAKVLVGEVPEAGVHETGILEGQLTILKKVIVPVEFNIRVFFQPLSHCHTQKSVCLLQLLAFRCYGKKLILFMVEKKII